MNSLTFEQRQVVEADIHGVGDVIEETATFIHDKIELMQEALAQLRSPGKLDAWERAIFLRPSLEQDRKIHLMFLRACKFQPNDAAILMAAYYREKRILFGDDLLIHRITWNDLTKREQEIFRSGIYQLIPNNDRMGRGIVIARFSEWDLADDIRSVARCIWYVNSAMDDDPTLQRRGIVTVVDYGAKWIPPSHLKRLVSELSLDAVYFHHVCLHGLHDESSKLEYFSLRSVLPKNLRVRLRGHSGSCVEMGDSLRTFGIDLLNCGIQGIENDVRKRQQLDEEWRESEAPFCDPTSAIALFPNPQDIILGHKKSVTQTWPGNVVYHRVIDDYSRRYREAQDHGASQMDKTLISMEVLHIL